MANKCKGINGQKYTNYLTYQNGSVYSYAACGHVFRKDIPWKRWRNHARKHDKRRLKKQWNDMRKAAELLKTGKGKIVKEK